MSKQTMVMVLSEHAEIGWNRDRGTVYCVGCGVKLCDSGESMETQGWRLREHQADQMLSSGLGLTRPAEAEAWDHGLASGWDAYAAYGRDPDGFVRTTNPYLED